MGEAFPASAEEIDALSRFMEQVAVPLLAVVGADDDIQSLGTGTIIEIEKRQFLITADHLFDGFDPENLAVPLGRRGGQITTLGSLKLARPNPNMKLDVAVLELLDSSVVRRLQENWRFLTLDNVGPAHIGATHILAGFPSALTETDDTTVRQTPLALYTKMLSEPPADANDVNPAWDQFFVMGAEAVVLTGEVAPVPRLQGASGASVWELSKLGGALWAPERVLKVIGVQQSALHGKWFRATSWHAVIAVLKILDFGIAKVLTVSVRDGA
jgi:hypothetical protein